MAWLVGRNSLFKEIKEIYLMEDLNKSKGKHGQRWKKSISDRVSGIFERTTSAESFRKDKGL